MQESGTERERARESRKQMESASDKNINGINIINLRVYILQKSTQIKMLCISKCDWMRIMQNFLSAIALLCLLHCECVYGLVLVHT